MSDADHRPLPRGMLALSWIGVLPFAAALLLAIASPAWQPFALAAFVAYGAVILSFLGGARWGRGLAADVAPTRCVEAVLPSLIGFAALLLVHRAALALAVLAAGFAIWLVIDQRDALWSPAYKRMRLGISVVVLALHAAWLLT